MKIQRAKSICMGIVFILLFGLLAGCSIPGIVDTDIDHEEGEADVPSNGIEEDENDLDEKEDENDLDEKEDEAPEVDTIVSLLQRMSRETESGFRPKTRALEVDADNGREEMVFRLLNLPSLPFSTYIPGEPETSPYFLLGHGHLWGKYADLPQGQEIVLIGRSDEGQQLDELDVSLEILLFDKDTDAGAAKTLLKKEFENIEEIQPLDSGLPAWVQEAQIFSHEGDRAGFLVLGLHEDIRFGLRSTWLQDQERSWLSMVGHMLEQWTWEEKTVERPSEQVFTTFAEGMEELRSYCLIERPEIPATTYYPCDRLSQVHEVDTGSAEGLRLGYMDIMFFEETMDRRGAQASFQQVVSYMGALEPQPEEKIPSWALSKYAGLQSGRSMTAILGEHQGRYFYIREDYPAEAGDGWFPLRTLFLNQWRWKDTGEALRDIW